MGWSTVTTAASGGAGTLEGGVAFSAAFGAAAVGEVDAADGSGREEEESPSAAGIETSTSDTRTTARETDIIRMTSSINRLRPLWQSIPSLHTWGCAGSGRGAADGRVT